MSIIANNKKNFTEIFKEILLDFKNKVEQKIDTEINNQNINIKDNKKVDFDSGWIEILEPKFEVKHPLGKDAYFIVIFEWKPNEYIVFTRSTDFSNSSGTLYTGFNENAVKFVTNPKNNDMTKNPNYKHKIRIYGFKTK